jgi:hypothetical protein
MVRSALLFLVVFTLSFGLAWLGLRHLRKKNEARSWGEGEGVTLQPGESREFQLPEELRRLVEAGARVEFKEGPVVSDGGRHYHRALFVIVDGVPSGEFRVSWRAG